MEGRVDLGALERSRMLNQLSSGAIGHLRGASSFHDAEAMSQFGGETERSRGVSPTTLQQYASHFLPHSSLHPSSEFS